MGLLLKRCLCVALLATSGLALSGCGGASAWRPPVKPPVGLLFTRYSAPLTVNPKGAPADGKLGMASTLYVRDPLITGIDLAWDDASIKAAAEQGGLTEVYYADYEVMQVFGVFGRFTTRVYGK